MCTTCNRRFKGNRTEFDQHDCGPALGDDSGDKVTSTSTAGGVEGMGSDLLVCEPCDEDENVEVVAEGKTNSRSKKRKREQTWNGTWHPCKDCDFKAKHKCNLKQHRANIHNENVTWQLCEDCDYKTKKKSHLKQHRADIHNENVTWHYCKDCDFKAKKRSHFKRHRAAVHNEK